MAAFFTILIIATAFVAPWATISAFESGRLAGWMTAFVAVVCHVATWHAMSQNSEILFCFGAPWAAYEFICLFFVPMGVGEIREEKMKVNEG